MNKDRQRQLIIAGAAFSLVCGALVPALMKGIHDLDKGKPLFPKNTPTEPSPEKILDIQNLSR